MFEVSHKVTSLTDSILAKIYIIWIAKDSSSNQPYMYNLTEIDS